AECNRAFTAGKLGRQPGPRVVAVPRPHPGVRLVLRADEIRLYRGYRRVLMQLDCEIQARSRRRQHLDDENWSLAGKIAEAAADAIDDCVGVSDTNSGSDS